MRIDSTINENNLESDFQRIANELLNHWTLTINDTNYRIAEIEFYYRSNLHDDQYTHSHVLQKTQGNWYFHGSGLDLTIGGKEIYGGILIRAIYDLKNDKYIYGPLNVITELFKNVGSAFYQKLNFGLLPDSKKLVPFETLIKAPRVGLNIEKNPEMFNQYYRFLVMPKYPHKDKTQIFEALKLQGKTEEEANIIWK